MADRVEHLTGSERASLEHELGPLQEVGDRGDLVRVPEGARKGEVERPAEPINEASTPEDKERAKEIRDAGDAEDGEDK